MMPKVSQSQVTDITSEQIKAARAGLGISVAKVADETNIGIATLKRYEATVGVPNSRKGHLASLRKYFEAAGIEFIGTPTDRPGIRIGPSKTDSSAT